MRRNVEFDAEGAVLRGWLYLPDGPPSPFPAVVLAHGFSAVKEQLLDRYAQALADAGLAALVFDNRNFGSSEGTPRQEIDPWRQVGDYRHAVTFARSLPEIDKERIGVWGTSYSGGHVLAVAALDRRVRCVVSQVPFVSGPAMAARNATPEQRKALQLRFDADRDARFGGKPPAMLPLVSQDPAGPCVFPGPKMWEAFEVLRKLAPAWKNEVTLRSLELAREYEPGAYAARISPTPLLMIVCSKDLATPADLAKDAFARAQEPKKLVELDAGHFDAYTTLFGETSAAARDWFVKHLKS